MLSYAMLFGEEMMLRDGAREIAIEGTSFSSRRKAGIYSPTSRNCLNILISIDISGLHRYPLQEEEARPRKRAAHLDLPTVEEQRIALGELFDIQLLGGYDLKRRVLLLGFCRSTGLLYDTLADVLVSRGKWIAARADRPEPA